MQMNIRGAPLSDNQYATSSVNSADATDPCHAAPRGASFQPPHSDNREHLAMSVNMIDPGLQDGRPGESDGAGALHKLRLVRSPPRGPRSDLNARHVVRNEAGNPEDGRSTGSYAGKRQSADARQLQLHQQQQQLHQQQQQQQRQLQRTFYSQDGQSLYTAPVSDEGVHQYQQYAPPSAASNGNRQFTDLQIFYRQNTAQPAPSRNLMDGLHPVVPTNLAEAEPSIDNPPISDTAQTADRPAPDPQIEISSTAEPAVPEESPANPAGDTISRTASPTSQITEVPAEITAALLALEEYRASEGGQMETDEHDGYPATSNGVHSVVASPAKEIHPAESEVPTDTVSLEVVAGETDRTVELAVMETAVVAEAAVDTEPVVDTETFVIAKTTGSGQGLQLEVIEGKCETACNSSFLLMACL